MHPLTGRSRDNLPNPIARRDNLYVQVNMPAIGDLFDMFHFGDEDEHGDDQRGRARRRPDTSAAAVRW